MEPGPEARVVDNREEQRFEALLGDEVAGFLQYRARPGLIALIHTEVDERFAGQGLAGELVAFALDDARARGLAVLPFCPFASQYIQHHREYVGLVPEDRRAAFGL
jgi:uncharacterized protein